MKALLRLATIVAIFGLMLFPLHVSATESASKVLIVYNANYTTDSDGDGIQDSLEVANYYAAARNIASNHILGVNATISEDNAYTNFSQLRSDILQPIQSKLNNLGETSIDIIVLCYGVPYKYKASSIISIDNIISSLNWTLDNDVQMPIFNPYYEDNPYFDSNKKEHFSHSKYDYVDSHAKKDPIYLVTRLDGPLGVTGVLDLIDRSLYAQKYVSTKSGYFTGNAYVDSQRRYGQCDYTDAGLKSCSLVTWGDWEDYDGVDVNIAFTERYINDAGLPLKWQVAGNIIGNAGLNYEDGTSAAVAPNALLYSGWYAYNDYRYEAWQWLPGAVGVDYDSTSMAYPIQSPNYLAWAVQALNYGITATCGNTAEPGVGGAHATSVLIYYLLQGYTFAEASELANPNIGGSPTMCIGDPLYAPFASKALVVDKTVPEFTSTPAFSQTTDAGAVVSGIINTSDSQPTIATFTLGYGTKKATTFSDWPQTVTNPGGYTRRFSIQAQNLKPNTKYYYQVQARGPLPKYVTALSDIGSFTTPAATAYASQNVPGTIAVSDFDDGEDGVSWHASRPGLTSGQKVRTDSQLAFDNSGNLTGAYAEQWMNYTVNVTAAGNYSIKVVACDCYSQSVGSTFHMELDGVNVTGPVEIPKMGHSYDTIVMGTGIHFTAGTHVLKLVMESGPSTIVPMRQMLTNIGKFQSIIVSK